MNATQARLRIGFIPLADAAALIVAVDKGFAAAEGLNVELVREVSWSNVRDKLNIGLFDAAHLLAPVAIASKSRHRARQGADRGAVRAGDERQRHHGVARALRRHRRRRGRQHRRSDGVGARARPRRRQAQGQGRGAADLRDDLPVLDPQLSSALLDGGRRRRSRRGCPSRRAAAAIYGRQSGQWTRRRVLRGCALEFGRGRPRRRFHPAFRIGDSPARGREGAGDAR